MDSRSDFTKLVVAGISLLITEQALAEDPTAGRSAARLTKRSTQAAGYQVD